MALDAQSEAFSLQRRVAGGGTSALSNWGFRNETDRLTDVLPHVTSRSARLCSGRAGRGRHWAGYGDLDTAAVEEAVEDGLEAGQ